MLIFRLFFIVILLLLSACASSPEKTTEPKRTTISPKPVELKSNKPQSDSKTAIDPDVMFMLLTAEIAGQREQYDVALEGYMEAAKRVKDPRFAERAAVIAMYMKDSPKTQEAVSLWLKQDSKNLTARKIAALSALRANDKNTALEHLTVLLKADPTVFETTALELAGVLQKEDKLAVVYDTLTLLAQQQPNQATIHLAQAVIALQAKNTAVAEQQIQQVLKIKPDWDKALILQAQIAMLSGDVDKAKKAIKAASLKYPNNEKIKKLYAQLLIKTENYKEAEEQYRQLIEKDPKDIESQFTLALVYMELKKNDAAEDIFNQLLEQPNWQGQANYYLGKIAAERGDIERAVEYFDKVTQGDLAFDAALEAVSLLAKDKQYGAANTRLATMGDRFPKQKLRIQLMQAEMYTQQKDYQKAFDVLSSALTEQPEQPELLYTRALVAEHLNKRDVLEKDLKQLLAKDPKNAEALNALGYSLLDDPTRYKDAEGYLQQAIQLRPDEAVIMDSYGWLLFKLGRAEQALDYLQRAYAKQQENEIAAHIAEVLWSLGRKEEAKKLFNKAIKNAPDDEYLLDFQQRILNKAK